MKSIVKIAAFSAIALASTSVSAQHTWPMNYEGVVYVQKGSGPQLECEAAVQLDALGNATVSIAPGDIGCMTVIFTGNPYSYTYDHVTGALDIANVYANTTITPGNCAGNLASTKLAGVITVDDVLPAVTAGTGDCSDQPPPSGPVALLV